MNKYIRNKKTLNNFLDVDKTIEDVDRAYKFWLTEKYVPDKEIRRRLNVIADGIYEYHSQVIFDCTEDEILKEAQASLGLADLVYFIRYYHRFVN